MAEEAAKDYQSSLEELTFNSKLHINVLTMIAGENYENGYTEHIAKEIEKRLVKAKPDQKMPVLYLMDSIMKNLAKSQYSTLFSPNLVANFALVFEKVDEKKRQSMYKLRQTWTDIFPNFILYALDRKINELDPAWPVTARQEEAVSIIPSEAIEDQPLSSEVSSDEPEVSASGLMSGENLPTSPVASIHVNPRFLKKQEAEAAQKQEEEQLRRDLLRKQKELEERKRKRNEEEKKKRLEEEQEKQVKAEMAAKQAELLRLQQQKLEMELEETRRTLRQREIEFKRKEELEKLKEQEREKAHQKQLEEARKAAIKKAEEEARTKFLKQEEEKRSKERAEAEKIAKDKVEKVAVTENERKENLAKTEKSATNNNAEARKSVSSRDPRRRNVDPRKVSKPSVSQRESPSPVKDKQTADRQTDSPQRRSSRRTNSSQAKSISSKQSRNEGEFRRSNKRQAKAKDSKAEQRQYRRRSESTESEKEETLQIRPHRNRSRSPERRKRKLSPSGTEVIRTKKATSSKNQLSSKSSSDQKSSEESNQEKKKNEPKSVPEGKKDSSGVLELFGKVDVDYRSLPPIPKRVPPPPTPPAIIDPQQSPSIGWSKFKESRPETFMFRQPRRMSSDSEFSTPIKAIRGTLPGYEENKPVTKLSNPDDILSYAKMQRASGILNQKQYEELLVQLDELGRLQQLREEAKRKRESTEGIKQMPRMKPPPKPPLLNSPGARKTLLPLPEPSVQRSAKLSFDDDSMQSSPLTGDVKQENGQKKVLLPPPVPPRALLETPNFPNEPRQVPLLPLPPGGDKGSLRSRPLLPQPPAKPLEPRSHSRFRGRPLHDAGGPMRGGPRFMGGPHHPRPSGPRPHMGPPRHAFPERLRDGPKPGNGMHPNDEEPWLENGKYYVPEFDTRWYRLVHFPREKKFLDTRFEFVLNGSPFTIHMDRNKAKRILFERRPREVRLDPETFELHIDNRVYYRIHEPEREVMIGGTMFRIYCRGPPVKLWIDGHQFEVRVDAPPESVVIANVSCDLIIDRQRKAVVVNSEVVCPYDKKGIHNVVLGKNEHTFQFSPPSRTILIDGETCELDLSQRFPAIVIKGTRHGICFDGGPKIVYIDDKKHALPPNEPQKIRISGKPCLVALGGPGFEIIIEDEWYEVKFGGPPVFAKIGGSRVVKLQLEGPAPEVKILGAMTTKEEMDRLSGNVEYAQSDEDMEESPPRPSKYNASPVRRGPMFDRNSAAQMSQQGVSMALLPVPGQPGRAIGKQEPATSLLKNVNVDDLFSKLLSTGIIKKVDETGGPSQGSPAQRDSPVPAKEQPLAQSQLASLATPTPIVIQPIKEVPVSENQPSAEEKTATDSTENLEPKEKEMSEKEHKSVFDSIPSLTDFNLARMKKKQRGVFAVMYTGIQCTSCAARFRPEKTAEYKEHLDWHFRQNKREKQDSKVVRNRRWYYEISDWVAFEEIGDVEERVVSNYFENMLQSIQSAIGGAQSAGAAQGGGLAGGKVQEQCPIASSNDEENMCEICRDPFEQFYDDEEEEWHLRDAMRVEGRAYHPVCYEDFKEHMDTEEEEEMADESGHIAMETEQSPPAKPIVEGLTKSEPELDTNTEPKAETLSMESPPTKAASPKPAPTPIMNMVSNPLAYLNALSQRAKETNTSLDQVARDHTDTPPPTGSVPGSPSAKVKVEAMDTATDNKTELEPIGGSSNDQEQKS